MKIEFQKDKLAIRIYSNRQKMGAAAARDVVHRIYSLLETQTYVNIIFAAAPSQNEFLAGLRESSLDWNRVRAFHMDEYIGLADDAPQRFGNFLKHAIFSRLPFNELFYLDGNAIDEAAECRRYTALLKEYPVDIVCMGIGENGHIAFNDPPVADFNDSQWVKVVELEEACRQQQVNDKCFDTIDDVPTKALTLTVPALMAAKYLYCMVPAATKADAVFNTINEPVNEAVPASIIRTHPHATLYLDELSSAHLSIKEKV